MERTPSVSETERAEALAPGCTALRALVRARPPARPAQPTAAPPSPSPSTQQSHPSPHPQPHLPPPLPYTQEVVFSRDLFFMVGEGHLVPPLGYRVITDEDLSQADVSRGDFKEVEVGAKPSGLLYL